MRLPLVGEDYGKIDLGHMTEMVDAFLAAGGTYFDTAYPYHSGNSERAFQEAVVKRYPRERFYHYGQNACLHGTENGTDAGNL